MMKPPSAVGRTSVGSSPSLVPIHFVHSAAGIWAWEAVAEKSKNKNKTIRIERGWVCSARRAKIEKEFGRCKACEDRSNKDSYHDSISIQPSPILPSYPKYPGEFIA